MVDDQIQRELSFRQSSLDGLDRLAALYSKCFDVTPPENYFTWKYRDNPSGSLVGFEATHNDTVVASYAVIPEAYLVRGERRVVWQSMDTMTHPDYQRRGLFVTLANKTFDHLATIDPEFLLVGIPAPASHAGFVKKLGWHDIHQFRLMFQERRVFRLSSALRRPPKLTFRRVTDTSSLVPYFASRHKPTLEIQNELSPEFLNWRVRNNPMREYELVEFNDSGTARGIAAYTHDGSGKSFVVLLDAADPADLSRLTPSVLGYIFERTGARLVQTWEPMEPILRYAYLRRGMVFNPTTRGPMTFQQPLIVHTHQNSIAGFDPLSRSSYALQPIMQD